jgi:hypothetical protein
MKAFKNKIKITLVWQFGASSWKNGGIICGGKKKVLMELCCLRA